MSAIVHVEVDAAGVDAAVDVAWVHGALGVHTEDLVGGAVRLVTAFGDAVDVGAVVHELRARAPHAVVRVHDDDGAWWDAWRRHAAPVEVAGGRVVVVPAWLPAPMPGRADAVVARIDPGRTFGSGAHATTRLALEELARLPLAGARLLDVGGGSGVLSVVAVLLGARSALAVDVDPACVAVTLANAARNGVAGAVRATTVPLADLVGAGADPFDVVVANVLLADLEPLAPTIDRLATRWLVLGGMLADTTQRAQAAFPLWHGVRRVELDGWAGLLLSRDPLLAESNEDLPPRAAGEGPFHFTIVTDGGGVSDR